MSQDKIPYGRQDVNATDIDAVVQVLRSSFLTQGDAVPNFENEVANICDAKFAIAVNSATSALHIACLALGVGVGDIVWTSAITFVASSNCALYCGATVDFVDIDSQTNNLSLDALAEKLSIAKKENRLPKVLIVVHLCGQPCDLVAIRDLSHEYGFRIIEDASHAVGALYMGEPIGSGHYSDITVFSFHPVKIITTGEGGMALTNDLSLANHMRQLRSHGITRNESEMMKPPDGPWYYEQITLGYNYRMTDLQAALGLSQLTRLSEFLTARHLIAQRYDELLSELPIRTPWQSPDAYSAYHLYVIRLNPTAEPPQSHHLKVFKLLHAAGVMVNLHYIPVYLHPYYQRLGFTRGYCPEAERYYSEAISIPIYPALKFDQQLRVVDALKIALAT
jgi:UDP-4-amino-4,6-dideoxy-N-acetyl-beta-L-altrosamine transaminase